MAHIRRKFFEAKDHHPQAAEYALGEIANWYAQERKYRENGLSPQEKLLRRQEDIKAGFDAFKEWVETQHKEHIDQGSHRQGIALCRQPTSPDRTFL